MIANVLKFFFILEANKEGIYWGGGDKIDLFLFLPNI